MHLLWNHDTGLPLASTDSGTLDLREDATGLRVWARVPKGLSTARDMQVLAETGIATGMSFAFTLPEDGSGETWTRGEDGVAERTITEVEALYDVSATPRGAYKSPQYSMRSVYSRAVEAGRVPEQNLAAEHELESVDGKRTTEHELEGADGSTSVATNDGAMVRKTEQLASLKTRARVRVAAARSK